MAADPTRNERQRLWRARRKAEAEGLVEVTVGGARFWVPPKVAEKIVRLAEPSNVVRIRRTE